LPNNLPLLWRLIVFRKFHVTVFLCLTLLASSGADWATFQADISRSGISAESPKAALAPAWIFRSDLSPRPAWPAPAKHDYWHRLRELRATVTYDRAFHTVIVGDRLFFGSSADDKVCCLDVNTGRVVWQFYTEGPVRLAPTVAGDKVYFGSDDGKVYCLAASTGKLIWSRRIAQEDRRIPGNGRMISVWPIRTGILVDGDVAYCCAGFLPSQGVVRCALNAESGDIIWRHDVEDMSPQGYMLASATRLYMPTGRTSPMMIDRASGKLLGAMPGQGGTYALLTKNRLISGPGRTSGGLTASAADSPDQLARFGGLRIIVDDNDAFMLTKDQLIALDFENYATVKNKQDAIRWTTASEYPFSLILAGDTLFAGGDGQVGAFNRTTGRRIWKQAIKGKAHGLSFASGRLFVSTDQGAIHCFAPDVVSPSVSLTTQPKKMVDVFPADGLTSTYERAAQFIVRQTADDQGYCLVLGSEQGRLAAELARRTKFRIIGVEPDAQKAAASRDALRQLGLYGDRVVIHTGSLDALPYCPYFANLIVSDAMLLTGKLSTDATELFRMLRPQGGTAVLGGNKPEAGQTWLDKLSDAGIPQVKRSGDQGEWAIVTRGALPGAGSWTHLYATPANEAATDDRIVDPSRVQWFGSPGPRDMIDRHHRSMSPLFGGGRLFVTADDRIIAVDAYNGTILWQRDVPESRRIGALKDCGHIVLADDRLLVAVRDRCEALDLRSGKTATRFRIPGKTPNQETSAELDWGFLALAGDTIVGTTQSRGASFHEQDYQGSENNGSHVLEGDFRPVIVSRSLFSIDRKTGDGRWQYKSGAIMNSAIAIGPEHLYFVESRNPVMIGDDDGRVRIDQFCEKDCYLVALDVASGQKVWERPLELPYEHIIFLCHADNKLLLTGSHNVGRRVQYELSVFHAEDGRPAWNNDGQNGDGVGGSHGEQWQHPVIIGQTIYLDPFAFDLHSGKQLDFELSRGGHGCGTLSGCASYMFGRGGNPRLYDLSESRPSGKRLTFASRPGCWINMLPVGGLVLLPESSSGCTCAYPLQTSFAFGPAEYYGQPLFFSQAEKLGTQTTVEIASANGMGHLHYTLDGSLPTAKSPAYAGPITISGAVTVRAKTIWANGHTSAESTFAAKTTTK